MQRRQTVKMEAINTQTKRKKSPSKSHSPLKHKKKGKKNLVVLNKNGSKRSIRLKQSFKYLPLNNFQIKQRLLDKVTKRKDKKNTNNTSNDQSAKSHARYMQPNGEYFGSSHSINPHLQHSKNSKLSKNSKSSSKSKSQSNIFKKMKEYRELQAKQLGQIEAISGASPKEIKRLQKMHSLERIQVIEQLVGAQRYL